MPLIGLLFGMYYVLGPLLGVDNVWGGGPTVTNSMVWLDPQRDYDVAMRLALAGWIVLEAGYVMGNRVRLPGRRALARMGADVSARDLRWWAFAFLIIGIVFDLLMRAVHLGHYPAGWRD